MEIGTFRQILLSFIKLKVTDDLSSDSPNNRFNLTSLLSRFVLLASLAYAQTAPAYALQVKRMLEIQKINNAN